MSTPAAPLDSPPSPEVPLQREAIESLAAVLGAMCGGGICVDADARVTWISEGYRLLLGIEPGVELRGRPVQALIPNSLLPDVIRSGRPIPVDLMQFEDRWFVVMRMPIKDGAGRVTGAVGFVLYDRLDFLKPLVSKFSGLQTSLAEARKQLASGRAARYSLAQVVGASPAIVRTRQLARRAAQGEGAVLLLGETGTGKELLAHAIHAASRRAARPFVGINLAALPESLLEAELFGVAAGAYTGAAPGGRVGKFKLADGGTLFLDEVSELPLHLQAKLLRALEEHEIEPLGSNKVERVDLRVIAASNRDLETLVASGGFRADLFYRLNVLPLTMPPLRERTVDLEALCDVLLGEIGDERGVPPPELTREALLRLALHAWPGNVRELRNVLERAATLVDESRLDARHFDEILPPAPRRLAVPPGERAATLAAVREAAEREAIRAALVATGGRRDRAARRLGIGRATLYEKMRKLGID